MSLFSSDNLYYLISNKIIISILLMKNPNPKQPNNIFPQQTQSLPNLYLIQNQVQKRLSNPQQSSYCPCQICLSNYQFMQSQRASLYRQTSSSMKIQGSKMQQFLCLVQAVSSRVYCKLDIPEICFFWRGYPKRLFRSNNTGVHQVELTTNVVDNLAQVFLQDRKLNTTIKNEYESLIPVSRPPPNCDRHIKNFGTVIPSWKHGEQQSYPVASNKAMTFYFHDRQDDDDYPVGMMGVGEEICILKLKDKGFELINEKQLRGLVKSVIALQNVQYIQTYIRPNPTQKSDQIFEANYSNKRGTENKLMYERSRIQVKIDINLVNKFSSEYIPLQQIEKYEYMLKQDMYYQYCLYQTYKMVHYMQLTKDVKVQKIGTLWLKNEERELCFFGLSDFQWKQNQKIEMGTVEIEELKVMMNSQLTDFQQELLHAWESMKRRKMKPEEKLEVDEVKKGKLEMIRRESSVRMAKEKEKQKEKQKMEKNQKMDRNVLRRLGIRNLVNSSRTCIS